MLCEGKAPILWGFANPKALAKTGIKFRFRIAANYQDIIILCAVKMTPKEPLLCEGKATILWGNNNLELLFPEPEL